ncbi:RibD domain-containing protein [Prauserella shujinwangii]|uniref:RibD domain-containing protein n=1 Tax=Prauserella shujinwangii TaxID=1453103 RepID=A0A2T0M428_9PSEU|nr:RibD domain-containing protein [Prauserella shujinwangii]
MAQAPAGEHFEHRDWSLAFNRGADGERFTLDEALAAEALLLGRRTYDLFAGAWPDRDGPLADKYNSMPKYVVSATLTDPAWNNTHVVTGDLVTEVAGLRDALAGEIQVPGSIQLVRALLAGDLVGEIRLLTLPVVLGTGRRLFGPAPGRTRWRLAGTRTVGEGLPITVFHRHRADPAT